MKPTFIPLLALCVAWCGKKEERSLPLEPHKGAPAKLITAPIVERIIQGKLKHDPKKELTEADLDKVTRLNIESAQLTDVKGLEKLTKLEHLSLSGNQLIDVEGLENLTQLERLDLTSNLLTDVPKGLEKLPQLRTLSLNNNELTSVKELEKLTQLLELDLRRNEITKAQIAGLKKALPKCRISSDAKK